MIRYRGFASVLPNDELPYGDFVRERKHDLLKVKGDPFLLVVFQQFPRVRPGPEYDPTERQQETCYEKDEQQLDYPVTSLVERKIAFVGFHLRSIMSNLPSRRRSASGLMKSPSCSIMPIGKLKVTPWSSDPQYQEVAPLRSLR